MTLPDKGYNIMKIIISQEGSSPIEIDIADNKNPAIKSNENLCPERSQEFFLVNMAIGFLIFYLVCCLISIPFTVANKTKDKKLLKLAENMISKMSDSEKAEIKKFVNTVLFTQKLVEEQITKKYKEVVVKHTKANGLKTYNHDVEVSVRNGLMIKDDSEKSIKELYKKIIKILNDTTEKTELHTEYEIDDGFIIEGYYDDDNIDAMLDKTHKAINAVEKEIPFVLSAVSIDKSKFSLDGGQDFDEYESCPNGDEKRGDCQKYWGFTVNLSVNKKYISKVFKPLFDKCKTIK